MSRSSTCFPIHQYAVATAILWWKGMGFKREKKTISSLIHTIPAGLRKIPYILMFSMKLNFPVQRSLKIYFNQSNAYIYVCSVICRSYANSVKCQNSSSAMKVEHVRQYLYVLVYIWEMPLHNPKFAWVVTDIHGRKWMSRWDLWGTRSLSGCSGNGEFRKLSLNPPQPD